MSALPEYFRHQPVHRKGIIYLDAEVSDGALDFGVAEQELHGP